MSYLNIDPTLCRGRFTRWEDYGDDWIVEEKYDGDRRIAQFTAEKTYFTGRRDGINTGNKRDVSDCLPNLGRVMPGFEGLILDGELRVPGGTNSDVTNVVGGSAMHAMQQLRKPEHPGIHYRAFDILAEPGRDLTLYTWEQRRERLLKWDTLLAAAGVGGSKQSLTVGPVQPGSSGRDMYEEMLNTGREGVILKWRRSKYTDQRYWVKVKPHDAMVVRCTGFKAGEGKYQGQIGAIYFEQGMVHGSCSGMTDRERAYMTEQGTKLIGKLFKVKYTAILPSGALKHPRFVEWSIAK